MNDKPLKHRIAAELPFLPSKQFFASPEQAKELQREAELVSALVRVLGQGGEILYSKHLSPGTAYVFEEENCVLLPERR